MGFTLIKSLSGAQLNRKQFYLDGGVEDLPPIIDRVNIMPGSEAFSLDNSIKWILNSDYEWIQIVEGAGNLPDVPDGKSYVRSHDSWKVADYAPAIVETELGDLNTLNTVSKDSIVAAINEVMVSGLGEKGDKGDKGDTGAQGPAGPTGAKGEPGVNAVSVINPRGVYSETETYNEFDVAIASDGHSYMCSINDTTGIDPVGDITAWSLFVMQGPAGPAGPTGQQGAQGIQGIAGAAGQQGIQGIAGPQGPKGADGIDGAIGPQGPAGTPGAKGETGPQGIPGQAGAQGIPGAEGAEGPAGPVGAQGETGPAGPKGDIGATGPKGDTGPIGIGIPEGGDPGQVLIKNSIDDFDFDWETFSVDAETIVLDSAGLAALEDPPGSGLYPSIAKKFIIVTDESAIPGAVTDINYTSETRVLSIYKNDNSLSTVVLPEASDTIAGLMTPEDRDTVVELVSDVQSLKEGGVWRAEYATFADLAATYPQLDVSETNWFINDYVEVLADERPTAGIHTSGNPSVYRVIYGEDETIKTLEYQKDVSVGSATNVQIATQNNLGIVKGADVNGKIFVETDGTMSMVGYDQQTSRFENIESEIAQIQQSSDIANSPHLWPDNGAEVDLLDGTFGKRFTGIRSGAGATPIVIEKQTPGLSRIIEQGGYWQVRIENIMYKLGVPGVLAGLSYFFYNMSTSMLTWQSQCPEVQSYMPYDVWVRYTK